VSLPFNLDSTAVHQLAHSALLAPPILKLVGERMKKLFLQKLDQKSNPKREQREDTGLQQAISRRTRSNSKAIEIKGKSIRLSASTFGIEGRQKKQHSPGRPGRVSIARKPRTQAQTKKRRGHSGCKVSKIVVRGQVLSTPIEH
jgi:hypothetical protein